MYTIRSLRRCITQEKLLILVLSITLLLFYLHYLHQEVVKGGWTTTTHNASERAELLWDNRVVKGCLNKSAIVAGTTSAAEALQLLGEVRNKQDKYIRDIGYKHHAFNALVSNNIGSYRDIPDTRHKVCSRKPTDPNEKLPTTSVIMCFFNEHKMTLIRSLKSVLERTPRHLLHEIILVDDFSDAPELEFHLLSDLHAQLQYSNLHYIRNTQREGLIRSRVKGAREASGDVLIFLDSHVEVNEQWVEPLLRLVRKENSTLAVPVMDLINSQTFVYSSSPLVRGGFNWALHYQWISLPKGTLKKEKDFSGPFLSPTMAGGLFAINRQYFHHIGEYDMGMDIWGGENLEISFRVWQCGGAIKIVPCSRVGHVFRHRRPYAAPDGSNTMLKNSLRLAHVWLDEYIKYYAESERATGKHYDYGNITDRMQLRQRLNCKSFDWYLKHVYPELHLPGSKQGGAVGSVSLGAGTAPPFQPWHARKRNYTDVYMLRLTGTDFCASVVAPKVKGFWRKGSFLTLEPCQNTKGQIWYETDKSEIVLDRLLCLEATDGDSAVVISKCHEMLGDQQWQHVRFDHSAIYNMASGTCLRASASQIGARLTMDLCSKNDGVGAWDFVRVKGEKTQR